MSLNFIRKPNFVINLFFDPKIPQTFIFVVQSYLYCLKRTKMDKHLLKHPTRVRVSNIVMTFFLIEWTCVTLKVNVKRILRLKKV